MDRRQFARLVRQALTHLYDHAYLQRHPLAAIIAPGVEPAAAGQMLHRALLEAVGALRPPPRVPPSAAAWRPYLLLCQHFVEGAERRRVAEELGISLRHYSRELHKAIAAVAESLWARLPQPALAPGEPSLLEAEASRLGTAQAEGATPLAETVEGVVATLVQTASGKGVSLAPLLTPGLPAVLVERVVLRQVLLNVLSHAIERGPGATVELVARALERHVELTVRCAGRGRAAAPDAMDDDRLALAARLLEAQGGRLVQVPGAGLTVCLALPLQHPATVLVVDDNPDLLQLFRRFLAESPYQVVTCASGRDALRLAEEAPPLAITLDVMMPGQDGWEVLQTLKNQPATRGIPVIVCSVLRERALALNLGADEFLVKPVTQQTLLAALAHCARMARPAAPPGSS